MTVTLHRVATRQGEDRYHVAFRDAAVYEFAHPPARGSAAEWVEHHVFSHAPDARFEALTPECDREHDAPAIGTVYVRDGRLVGLALDADALAPRVATDGGNIHASTVAQLTRAAANDTLPDDIETATHGCPEWPDRATVHVPVDQACEACGWTPGDGGDR